MEGYNINFLENNHVVGFPDYSHYAGKIAKNKQTGDDILTYTYYSVLQNKSRRIPIFSASNIFRTGFEQVERVGTFSEDERIDELEQLTSKDYSQFNSIKAKQLIKGT
jgi:endonuclease G